jgi:enoyl-[acyl-carrier-protein] reductase (NADH)
MVCLLLSDWTSKTTGEIVHVDAGFHSQAAGVRKTED